MCQPKINEYDDDVDVTVYSISLLFGIISRVAALAGGVAIVRPTGRVRVRPSVGR